MQDGRVQHRVARGRALLLSLGGLLALALAAGTRVAHCHGQHGADGPPRDEHLEVLEGTLVHWPSSEPSLGTGQRHVRLKFDAPAPAGLATGTVLKVWGHQEGGLFAVRYLQVEPVAQLTAELGKGAPRSQPPEGSLVPHSRTNQATTGRISTVTFIASFSACGMPPATTVEDFQKIWTNRHQPSTGSITMQDMIGQCSYGKAQFLDEDNWVVGPVHLPCSGEINGQKFSAFSCTDSDFWGWQAYVQSWAQSRLSAEQLAARHHILILPSMPECGWDGMAVVGCQHGPCFIWMNGRHATSLPSLMHELGHTMGLPHVHGIDGREYSDCSGAMSNCGAHVCHNAIQSWALGWTEPIAKLEGSDLRPGVWLSFFIPALQGGPEGAPAYPQSFVVIRPDWADLTATQILRLAPSTVYVISYREATNGDWGLSPTLARQVYLHAGLEQAQAPPVLRATLATGDEYPLDEINMVISFDGIKAGFAGVRVCRWRSSPAECGGDSPVQNMAPPCGASPSSSDTLDNAQAGGDSSEPAPGGLPLAVQGGSNSASRASSSGGGGAQAAVRWANDARWLSACRAEFASTSVEVSTSAAGRGGLLLAVPLLLAAIAVAAL